MAKTEKMAKTANPENQETGNRSYQYIKGIPNVIAQYSQSEYGEYVRTTDGGVLYKVYDETGQIAPKAQVKGMPGINAEKLTLPMKTESLLYLKKIYPKYKT